MGAARRRGDDIDSRFDRGNHEGPQGAVAVEEGRVVGAAAMERHGGVGLLRSVVVAPERRKSGLGGTLVRTVEQRGRAQGIGLAVLLTETAGKFFAARGYAVRRRVEAPAAVARSSEFMALCPVSAVYMEEALR